MSNKLTMNIDSDIKREYDQITKYELGRDMTFVTLELIGDFLQQWRNPKTKVELIKRFKK